MGKSGGEAMTGDIKTGAWTPDEDVILAAMQAKLGNRWSAVAQHIPGRTGQQCAQRWRHKVNPNIRKEKWTEEEDRHLESLVKEYGSRWAEIARRCEGRTDQQCMGRWRRHLDPNIRRDSWRSAEDALLKKLHNQYGSQWSLISKQISGRTAQQCRARFFQILEPEESPDAATKPPQRRQSSGSARAKSQKRKSSSELSDSDLEHDSLLATPHLAYRESSRPTRKRSSRKTSKQTSPEGSLGEPSFAASIDKGKKAEAESNGASASSGEENSSLPLPFPSLDFVTPKKVQLADSGRNSSVASMHLPPLAALSPQQQLALSPFLAQWCSPLAGMTQRLSPSPMQESLQAQWRLSPTVLCSPGTQLPCTGGTPQLFSTGCLTPPTMSSSPRDKAMATGDAEGTNGRSAGRPPAGSLSFRGRLGESVKRKLSLVSATADEDNTEHPEADAFSTPPKRPQALVFPTSLPEAKEYTSCTTPLQLQQTAAHAGRPSLTPLSSLASMATDVATTSQRASICSVNGDLDAKALAHARAAIGKAPAAPEPEPKPAEAQEGLMDKENSQPAPAIVQLPRPAVHPKKQLMLRSGESVAGSRSRLNALLGIE